MLLGASGEPGFPWSTCFMFVACSHSHCSVTYTGLQCDNWCAAELRVSVQSSTGRCQELHRELWHCKRTLRTHRVPQGAPLRRVCLRVLVLEVIGNRSSSLRPGIIIAAAIARSVSVSEAGETKEKRRCEDPPASTRGRVHG